MPLGAPTGIARNLTGLAVRAVLLAAVMAAVASPAVAGAASVAYVDKGEVWLASVDDRHAAGRARAPATAHPRPEPSRLG